LFYSVRGWGWRQIKSRREAWPLITPPKQTHKAEAFIALDQAKQLWYRGAALFLDTREPADYSSSS
jgi:hypothetical protein